MASIENGWTVNDPVHGNVTFHSYVQEIVDTMEFQRLRNLKQLGAGSKVFPSVTHTRFEHCLGVCHSAEKLLKILELNSGVQISQIHRKCVLLAALLHDIGHGPFSHMWENFVHSGSDKHWTHEQSSCDMARELFAKNNIQLSQEAFEHYYGEQLICALITGNQEALETLLTPDTMYLSEIVHNKRYKIDVDKWDYLLRDMFYLKSVVQVETDFVQLFDNARVLKDESGITHIGYRSEDYRLIVALFEARTKLHIDCYQHPTILGLEKLLIDALKLAEDSGFRLRGAKISEAHLSPSTYIYLDDSIVNLIESSENSLLQGAQQLLARIRMRRMYTKIHMSLDGPYDMEDLNKRFGDNTFFQVCKRIPYASQMTPRNVPLYEVTDSGKIQWIDTEKVAEPALSTLEDQGFFEQHIVFCKSAASNLINSAREYLMEKQSIS